MHVRVRVGLRVSRDAKANGVRRNTQGNSEGNSVAFVSVAFEAVGIPPIVAKRWGFVAKRWGTPKLASDHTVDRLA